MQIEAYPFFTYMCDLDIEQMRKVKSLIRCECCNHEDGNCKRLDNGEYVKCPQLTSDTLKCVWFREAVLPLNKELEADLFNTSVKIKNSEKKRCASCGKPIESKANRAKYCVKCAINVHKKQKTEKARKYRMKVDN